MSVDQQQALRAACPQCGRPTLVRLATYEWACIGRTPDARYQSGFRGCRFAFTSPYFVDDQGRLTSEAQDAIRAGIWTVRQPAELVRLPVLDRQQVADLLEGDES